MPISSAIYKWRPTDEYHNFGDHLMYLINR